MSRIKSTFLKDQTNINQTKGRLQKKPRKFSELGLICLSTYLPPLNCDDVNSDNWPEIS